jgi:hypothetical protein
MSIKCEIIDLRDELNGHSQVLKTLTSLLFHIGDPHPEELLDIGLSSEDTMGIGMIIELYRAEQERIFERGLEQILSIPEIILEDAESSLESQGGGTPFCLENKIEILNKDIEGLQGLISKDSINKYPRARTLLESLISKKSKTEILLKKMGCGTGRKEKED